LFGSVSATAHDDDEVNVMEPIEQLSITSTVIPERRGYDEREGQLAKLASYELN
jgi:hypothetical protein